MAKSTFFSQAASNKLHSSESKKRDANEILLSMSVPDDAISAVLFLDRHKVLCRSLDPTLSKYAIIMNDE